MSPGAVGLLACGAAAGGRAGLRGCWAMRGW